MKATRWLLVLVLVVSAVAWAGCGGKGGTGGKLEGIRWVLESYDLNGKSTDVPADLSIDALFERGKVSGFSGVNTYTGGYELSGSSLTIGKLATTLMAGTPELMAIEQAYTKALEKTSSFTAESDGLTLFDNDGEVVLTYAKGKTPSLTGGPWEAVSYFNGGSAIVGVINGTTLTSDFSKDGKVTGSAGMNEYEAAYETEGKKISIGTPTLTTSNVDGNPDIAAQETNFLAALALAKTYRVSGDTLELLRDGGTIAVTYKLAK
jgi:heat shock protein HslJ